MIRFPVKLNCTENQLVAEYSSMWLLLTKAWRKFKDSTPKPTATKRFLQHIIGEYAVEYPNICNQILTLMEI